MAIIFRSSFFTPSSLIMMFLESVYSGRLGFGEQRSLNSSAVTVYLGLNIEQNWLLRSWACSLPLGFVMSNQCRQIYSYNGTLEVGPNSTQVPNYLLD